MQKTNQFGRPVGAAISISKARQSWFVLNGSAYSVEQCSTEQFKQFIKPHMAWLKETEIVAMYKQDNLDIFDRWYMLCFLSKACKALYASQAAAEQAIEQVEIVGL